jgi:hypothetical protein
MAKLDSAERDKLPASAFAIPEKRAYPIHDQNHAHAALSMVSAHGTPDEKSRVRSAVARRYPGIVQDSVQGPEQADPPGPGGMDQSSALNSSAGAGPSAQGGTPKPKPQPAPKKPWRDQLDDEMDQKVKALTRRK